MTDPVEPIDTEVGPLDGALDAFRDRGFTAQFEVVGSPNEPRVRCHACGHDHEPEQVEILDLHRYEGISDPEDEETILALTCPCGDRGTLTVAPGAYADPGVPEAVRRLPDRRGR